MWGEIRNRNKKLTFLMIGIYITENNGTYIFRLWEWLTEMIPAIHHNELFASSNRAACQNLRSSKFRNLKLQNPFILGIFFIQPFHFIMWGSFHTVSATLRARNASPYQNLLKLSTKLEVYERYLKQVWHPQKPI